MDPVLNAKRADPQSQRIVSGYIHEMESKLNLPEVASLIISIVLGFYCGEYITSFLREYFERSKDKLTITKIKHSAAQHTIYFNQWVHSKSNMIIKWIFKINKTKNRGSEIYFGLVSQELQPNIDFSNGKQRNYCIDNCGRRYRGNNSYDDIVSFKCRDGNMVTFTLDLRSKQWFGKVTGDKINYYGSNNGIHRGEDCKIFDIDVSDHISYKFVLQLQSYANSVTLEGFEMSH